MVFHRILIEMEPEMPISNIWEVQYGTCQAKGVKIQFFALQICMNVRNKTDYISWVRESVLKRTEAWKVFGKIGFKDQNFHYSLWHLISAKIILNYFILYHSLQFTGHSSGCGRDHLSLQYDPRSMRQQGFQDWFPSSGFLIYTQVAKQHLKGLTAGVQNNSDSVGAWFLHCFLHRGRGEKTE